MTIKKEWINDKALARFNGFLGAANSTGCLLWKGPITPTGYGKFNVTPKFSTAKHLYAHLVARHLAGKPKTKLVNLCGNRECCTVDHWYDSVNPCTADIAKGGLPSPFICNFLSSITGEPLTSYDIQTMAVILLKAPMLRHMQHPSWANWGVITPKMNNSQIQKTLQDLLGVSPLLVRRIRDESYLWRNFPTMPFPAAIDRINELHAIQSCF